MLQPGNEPPARLATQAFSIQYQGLPALLLLLFRPEIVGNPLDVLVAEHVLPRGHVERRSRACRLVEGRRLSVADDRDDFVLGVVVGDVQERWDLAALGIGIGHATLQFGAVATDATEACEVLLAAVYGDMF